MISPRFLAGLLLALVLLPARAQQEHVTVGVLTFRPLALAQRQWQPLTDHLNRTVPGVHFSLKVFDYPGQQEALRNNAVDLLITQPAEYVRLVHENGLSSPLATLINLEQGKPVRAMGGAILARSDRTDLQTLSDLKGKRIAAPSLQSFGGYQLQAYELARAGVQPQAIVPTGFPLDLALQALLDQQADAAFVRTGLLESLLSEGRIQPGQLKVLNAQNYPGYPFALSTRLYPEWPVVAMPHLPEELSVRIAGALLSLPHGGERTRSMGLFGFTVPADYEPVRAMMRELSLPPFDAPKHVTLRDIWAEYRAALLTLLFSLTVIVVMALRELFLRQRLASFGNAMGEGMFVLDRHGRASYLNRAALDMLGHRREALLGKKLLPLIVAPASPAAEPGLLADDARWQAPFEGESLFVNARGQIFPVEVSSRPVLRKGRFLRCVTVFSDISERKLQNERVFQLAFYDTLTGLPNRRLLQDRLQAQISQPEPVTWGALLFSDLDRFKQLNDTLGHKVGDALLQAVARRISTVVADGGTVAHTGGDEFAVLLPALDLDPAQAQKKARAMAEAIRLALAEPIAFEDQHHQLSVSIGVVMIDGDTAGADELRKRADIAMYQAKASGRNTIRFFDEVIERQLSTQVAMEADLNQALAQQQFELFYQPQVDADGGLVGMEALLRWQHPQRGLVMPGQFIGLAEESGLILPIGQWVLEQACRQIVRWGQDPASAKLVVSVNICALQIFQSDFVEHVVRTLRTTGADPARLQLELTESVLARNMEDVIDKMNQLVALGITFSLDDFGTGYSSLNYLKRLPLHQLKIDASFVRDLMTDPNDAAITQTIIALGRSLDLEVIAEGVETVAQRDLLLRQGCPLFQGYLFGRPQPVAELKALIRAQTAALDPEVLT